MKDTSVEWAFFLGRLHPAIIHLPIGILFLVLLMELVTVLSRGKLNYPTGLAMLFAALVTVASTVFGILLADSEASAGPLISSHLRWGIATAALTVFALTLRCLPAYHLQKVWSWFYRVTLVVACGLLVWTGHQGGSITHGEDYLTEHLPWLANSNAVTVIEIPSVGSPVYYEPTIAALFAAKCNSCHKRAYFKGGLIMDSYEALLRGGESGPCIVPGDPDASTILTSVLLPMSDSDHMPPKDKPQLTTEEVAVIQRWLLGGALRAAHDDGKE
ncbi:c-type cytochrome domain-containing protein [Cerasicoccus frondis]|uniref:c-type cytochrome domain-containing protein n=1 Tax=Cerasicoccus frondis TaxID=490090 RepID=UPI002852C92A|nr:c-type cytochrome domain-containing protein [Cerasicoccus frondis]